MDLRGQAHFDLGEIRRYRIADKPQIATGLYSPRHLYQCDGSRLGDGLHSAFYHVLVVVSPGDLKDYEMGALGDYIAMVALSQLDSWTNASSCQHREHAGQKLQRKNGNPDGKLYSLFDGLYKAPDSNNLQEDAIAYQMEKTEKGH